MSEISVWNALCMIYVLKDGEGGGVLWQLKWTKMVATIEQ